MERWTEGRAERREDRQPTRTKRCRSHSCCRGFRGRCNGRRGSGGQTRRTDNQRCNGRRGSDGCLLSMGYVLTGIEKKNPKTGAVQQVPRLRHRRTEAAVHLKSPDEDPDRHGTEGLHVLTGTFTCPDRHGTETSLESNPVYRPPSRVKVSYCL
jgi:hypothetical protein